MINYTVIYLLLKGCFSLLEKLELCWGGGEQLQ